MGGICLAQCEKCYTLFNFDTLECAYAFRNGGRLTEMYLCPDCAKEARALLEGAGFPTTSKEEECGEPETEEEEEYCEDDDLWEDE